MRIFNVVLTGDYLDENGRVTFGDPSLNLLDDIPYIKTGFLLDQKPDPNDPTYWDRQYSLEIKQSAQRELNALGDALFIRIDRKILTLADNPRPGAEEKIEGPCSSPAGKTTAFCS